MASNSILINGNTLYEIPDSKMGLVADALKATKERPSIFAGTTCNTEKDKIGEKRSCCMTQEIT